MSGYEQLVTFLNMLGATCAVAANAWAARRGLVRLRPLRWAIVAYSCVYVVAYAWLVVHDDVLAWSKVMRGVSIVSWPLVWCAPAIIGVREVRAIARRIEEVGGGGGVT